ncbi:MAG: hypothetical protein ACI4AI_00735 [Paludibacteraceae bacterium]
MKKFFLFLLLVPAMLVQAQTQITCAQAREYASGVSGDNVSYNDGEVFVVRGYVTSIQIAWSSQYKNVSFWMADTQNGGEIIEAFRCVAETEADVPSVGDLVDVTGNLTKYNSTPQIAAGCTYQLVSSGIPPVNLGDKTIADFLAMKNTKDTCILTGVVANIVMDQTDPTLYNVYGNFDLVELGDPSVKVYIYGLLTPEKQSQQFRTMSVDAGDTLTIKAIYTTYNSNPQVANAIYVSHRDYVEPTSDPIDYTKTEVDFETDFAQGWDGWIGKTLTFTNDFYYCDTYSTTIASHRLRAPEQYGEEGTTAYNKAVAKNLNDSIHLVGSSLYYKNHRLGTIIRNLQATVTAANQLTVVNTPTIINNALPTERPDLGNPDLVVVGANIENFFVTINGYSGAKTEELLAVQKKKISTALAHMDADIYALCEVEQGPLAATELVRLLDSIAGKNQYSWVNAGYSTYDAIMVCFIYRSDKVQPYGSYLEPYTSSAMRYRMAIQGFEQLSTGEKFNISLNHFYAKISKTDADREDNMTKLIAKLPSATANDPDVLVLGDLNAYEGETALQKLCPGQGYVDLLQKYDPNGYSHAYNITTGFLDHAYCSPSMESQVTKAVSYHLNSDTPKSLYGYSSTGGTVEQRESMYRYADHDPILVGLKLGNTPTSIENAAANDEQVRKEIRHGQLIIIRGGEAFTVTGQRLY